MKIFLRLLFINITVKIANVVDKLCM